MDHLAEVMASFGYPLALTQLSGGSLSGSLTPLGLGPLQLLRVQVDRALHVTGAKQPSRQLVTLNLVDPQQSPPLRSHGHLLSASAVFGLEAGGEIHLTLPERSDVALLAMERQAFRQWAEELGCPQLAEQELAVNWLNLDPRRFEGLRRYLLQLFELAERQPELLAQPSWQRLAVKDFGPLLITGLAGAVELKPLRLRAPARIELVKQVQHWLAENPNLPITLDDLCRQVYVSRRCLIQGFREHLGMGPMAYLKLQRLHAVRRLLLEGDPRQLSVTGAASAFGFLNTGHFARDYRQLFGELPSDTLRARRPQLG